MERFDASIIVNLMGNASAEMAKLMSMRERLLKSPSIIKITLNSASVLSEAAKLRSKLNKILSPISVNVVMKDSLLNSQLTKLDKKMQGIFKPKSVDLSGIATSVEKLQKGITSATTGGSTRGTVPNRYGGRRSPVKETEDLLYRPTYTMAMAYGAIAGYPIKLASDYEQLMLQIDKAWQRSGQTSKKELDTLRDELMDIKGISGKAAMEIAADVAKQGISSSSEILEITRHLAVATEALEIPAEKASSYIAKILDINTLKMTGYNVERVTELLAHLSNTMSGVKPPDLVEVWKRSSKHLAEVNMGLEEQAALSAAVLQSGVSRYFSGSELPKFLRRLTSPVLDRSSKSFQTLGLAKSGTEMRAIIKERGAKGLIEVMKMFQGLSDTQREKALGAAGKQVLLTFKGEKELEKVNKALDSASKSAGAAALEWEKYTKTFRSKWADMKDTLDSFFLAMGDPVAAALKPLMSGVSAIGSGFRMLNKDFSGVTNAIFGGFGVLVGLKAVSKVSSLLFPTFREDLKKFRKKHPTLRSKFRGAVSSMGMPGKIGLAVTLIQLASLIPEVSTLFDDLAYNIVKFYHRIKLLITGKTPTDYLKEGFKTPLDNALTEFKHGAKGFSAEMFNRFKEVTKDIPLKSVRFKDLPPEQLQAILQSIGKVVLKRKSGDVEANLGDIWDKLPPEQKEGMSFAFTEEFTTKASEVTKLAHDMINRSSSILANVLLSSKEELGDQKYGNMLEVQKKEKDYEMAFLARKGTAFESKYGGTYFGTDISRKNYLTMLKDPKLGSYGIHRTQWDFHTPGRPHTLMKVGAQIVDFSVAVELAARQIKTANQIQEDLAKKKQTADTTELGVQNASIQAQEAHLRKQEALRKMANHITLEILLKGGKDYYVDKAGDVKERVLKAREGERYLETVELIASKRQNHLNRNQGS